MTQKTNRAPVVGGSVVLALAAAFLIVKEDVVLETYADPVHGWEVPTACAGQTGPHIKRGQRFTHAECMAMLDAETRQKAAELDACISQPMPAHSAAAVLSLAYNAGSGAVCRSTLVRQINDGQHPATYCQQFSRWVYAGGKDCRDPRNNCRGIVIRRSEERALCIEGAK